MRAFTTMSSARHPLEIFPDLVWREVIKHLSADDCRNCFKTCTYFEWLLKPSIMWWNFKEVLPMILGKGESIGFGEIMFRLNIKDMLRCRLVCQAWRNAMDDSIDNLQETSYAHNFEINFQNERQVDRLLSDIESHNLGPHNFKLKNIRLGVISEEDQGLFGDPNPPMPEEAVNAFYEKGYILLHSIGMNVTRVFIEGVMEYTPAGGLKLTELVHRYCKQMPNIKQLKIGNRQYENLTWENHVHYQNVIPEIDEYLSNTPFPPLPHLKSLIIEEEFVPLSLIRHLITTYRTQLEMLMLYLHDSIPSQLNLQILSNLQKLEIFVSDSDMMNESILNDLNFLEGLTCPLKHLTLYIFDPHVPLPVVKFLEKIQHLPIEDFRLKLCMTYEEWIPEFLRLGTVKFLSLALNTRHDPRFPNPPKIAFDFFECFPNLENLDITWWQDANSEEPLFADEKNIYLKDHLNDNMYRSNIWEILPKLNTVKYTRDRVRAIRLLEQQAQDENIDQEVDENLDPELDMNLDPELVENQELGEIGEQDEEEPDDLFLKRTYTRQQYQHFLNSIA